MLFLECKKSSYMKNVKIEWIASLIVLFVVLVSCRSEKAPPEEVYADVDVVRFEKILFETDVYALRDSAKRFALSYPDFLPLFTNRIIEIGDTSDPNYELLLTKFVTERSIYLFYQRAETVFTDFKETRNLLSRGLSRYQYYFPESITPVVYTYISGLNQSVVAAKGVLGISLDKYLGANEPLYSNVYPPIPAYLRRVMQKEYIVSDALRAWVVSDIDYQPVKNNFLSQMLNEARGVYITKLLLPELNDTILWGFTSDELEFCNNNEEEMWKYILEQKLLFSTDQFRINKFIEPGPFTKDFTRDSPGRAAVWVGYQIIDKYMSRNKDLTLSELAAENDFQKVLNGARYNP
ncbi:MAG TPA: hypothetical protein DDX98_11155 [Bacteroidales bacterium]|nr:hypothetical protein [Bacteroidales bacterium]